MVYGTERGGRAVRCGPMSMVRSGKKMVSVLKIWGLERVSWNRRGREGGGGCIHRVDAHCIESIAFLRLVEDPSL